MSVHRIKIESTSVPATVVYPSWSGEVEHTLENDSVFLRSKVNGDFTFKNAEYTIIKDVPDCELIEIYLEELCGETWSEKWRGSFTTYDVRFNENKCLAIVSPKPFDEYECFLEEWETDIVVSAAGVVVEVTPFAGTYEGGECCYQCSDTELPADEPVCLTPANWCFNSPTWLSGSSTTCDPGFNQFTTCFHRIVGIGTPTTPPPYGTGWTYISGNDWWRCPDAGDLVTPKFDQGRDWKEVLEHMALSNTCGLTVRSHFFGLNATHDAPPDNIAYTFATDNLQDLQLHQKSDIKRPYATDPAQSFTWKMTWRKLLEDLRIMLNVYWKIDGTDLILEHISYFEATLGTDYSNTNIALEYGKQEGGAPNVERFFWVDVAATFTEPHLGYPISYGDCGEGKITRNLSYFSNDVSYIATVSNPEEITDAGFCLIATEVVDGDRVIIDNNNPLGWVALHENLHKHNRYFATGNMNDTPDTAFLSTIKTRKLTPFTALVCCGDEFDPSQNITTLAGVGQIQKATVNYFAGKEANKVTIEANI